MTIRTLSPEERILSPEEFLSLCTKTRNYFEERFPEESPNINNSTSIISTIAERVIWMMGGAVYHHCQTVSRNFKESRKFLNKWNFHNREYRSISNPVFRSLYYINLYDGDCHKHLQKLTISIGMIFTAAITTFLASVYHLTLLKTTMIAVGTLATCFFLFEISQQPTPNKKHFPSIKISSENTPSIKSLISSFNDWIKSCESKENPSNSDSVSGESVYFDAKRFSCREDSDSGEPVSPDTQFLLSSDSGYLSQK